MGKGRRRRGSGDGSASSSKRPRRSEAKEGEDYCFVCKDGGDLRVCDFKGCHKAYHPNCVGKGSDFLNSDEEFNCEWHTCCICERRTRYYCFCCPCQTFCKGCVKQKDFVPVIRKTKGFCRNCLRIAIMIERNVDVDSDGERADFSDRETYEFLFKDYYLEIVKDKEGLTQDDLEKAYAINRRALNCKQDSDLEKIPDEEHSSDDEFFGHSDDGDEEPSSPSVSNGTSKKIKIFLKEDKSKKHVYMGWGSNELIGFLSSIGKDTSKSLDQFSAAEVVREYIKKNDLLQKDKKKNVICDDKLHSLFRKSKLKYNRIYSLLERHIAANLTSDDESPASSEDNDDSAMRKKARTVSNESSTPKCTSEINRSCFASLVRDNIKLIYLKRSLVMELLKEPDTLESKVIGCFVRVKNDPKDYSYNMPKRLWQLGQVTGIRKSSEEYKIRDTSTDVLLCISNMPDVKISMLADEDFKEEELDDLRVLVQKESFKRLTVGDLEDKARSIHRDIVSHWINKELQILERLIDTANEKGWRIKKHEYMNKKKLLREPSERQRLLEELPQVIPDLEDSKDTELQVTTQDKSIQKNTVPFEGTNGRRLITSKSSSEEKSKGINGGRACLKSCSEEKFKGTYWQRDLSLRSCSGEKIKATKPDADGGTAGTYVQKQGTAGTYVQKQGTAGTYVQKQATEANAAGDTPCVQKQEAEVTKADAGGDTLAVHVQRPTTEATKVNTAGDTPGNFVQKRCAEANDAGMKTAVIDIDDWDDDDGREKGGQTVVVDLEADDSGDTHPVRHEAKTILCRGHKHVKVKGGTSERRCLWYYNDPQGDEQGPFTMERLRDWWNSGYFRTDFRVWREGQTSDCAILLTDAFQLTS